MRRAGPSTSRSSSTAPRSRPFGRKSTTDDRTGVTHGLCYVDALQALHEITGEERYAAAAADLLRDFDAWPLPFPNDDFAAANLADPMRGLHGHAVHTVEHLRAVAFGSRDDSRLRSALHKLRFSTTPSGAVIGDESLHGLPHPQAGYEYCSLTELVFGLGRSAQVLADPALGDWLERVTFNAAQGARAADGKALAYLCSDTRLDATAHRPDSYSLLNGKHGRYKLSPTHDDIACCCNPNSTRVLPHYVSSMWLGRTDSPGLVALAYGPSELRTDVDGTYVQHPAGNAVSVRRPGTIHGRGRGSSALDPVAATTGLGERIPSGRHRERGEGRLDRHRAPVAGPHVLHAALRDVRCVSKRIRPVKSRCCVVRCSSCSRSRIARENCRFRRERTGRTPNCSPMTVCPLETLPIIDTAAHDLGFVPERVATDAPDRPWHESPLRLRSDGVTLVPIGCAPLRRADFRARPGRREDNGMSTVRRHALRMAEPCSDADPRRLRSGRRCCRVA